MQPASLKLRSNERRNDWKCCFCCHVRTGTIFFGIWHLILQFLALSVIAVVLSHPELIRGRQNALMNKIYFDSSSDIQLTLGHSSNKPFEIQQQQHLFPESVFGSNKLDYQDLNLLGLITFCTFIITLLMVYGAIKGKPAFLVPFFCLQLFDFAVSSLTAVSYLCYLPDMHRIVAESPQVPFQKDLLKLNPRCLSLLILLTFSLAMITKAYFLGVVWSCYKYLSLRQVASRRTIHYIDTDAQTLLPGYNIAVKNPPPSYAHVMAEQMAPHATAPPV